MTTQSQLSSETFLPEHVDQLAPVLSFLQTHERSAGMTASSSYALVGDDGHDRIRAPGTFTRFSSGWSRQCHRVELSPWCRRA